MCGIVGIVAKGQVNQLLFDAMTVLQHRGQDAAGMVTSDGKFFNLRKSNGLVRDVFHTHHMLRLVGHVGLGHVRYPTAGCESSAEAQPFYVNSPYGICLAHNGNLTNAAKLASDLYENDHRHLNTSSDSEILLNALAHELQQCTTKSLKPQNIFQAIRALHQRLRGGYAVVAMIAGFGIVGFRDPYGIRPLVLGKRTTVEGDEYMLASESVALSCLGFDLVSDVAPGEAIVIGSDGEMQRQQCADSPKLYPCLFEYVYLARPDSIIDGISVYKMRLRLGEKLAEKIVREYPQHDIDVVIPVPDTSRTAAHALAGCLGLKYREGFVKNRYIGRTFIMPGQTARRRSVRQKLNAIDLEFADKNVLLVDDSIVRGTTAREIVQMARLAGAKKVYFASAAPAVRYSNVYGIDIPAVEELVAYNRTCKEVADFIGADAVIYQDLADLIASAREGNPAIEHFEDSVFSGHYITQDIDQYYLDDVATRRKDAAKQKMAASYRGATSDFQEVMDIYNHS